MIFYPRLKTKAPYRQRLDKFRGYNHNLRIGSGEFYEMENLTSDDYPVLSVRKKRGFLTSLNYGCKGMFYVPEKGLFYLENIGGSSVLYLLSPDGVSTEITRLNPNPKRFALMGNNLIIVPEMKQIGLESSDTGGNQRFHVQDIAYSKRIGSGEILMQLCKEDGTLYSLPLPDEVLYSGGDFEDGVITVDDSVYPPVLKQYSKLQKEWVTVSKAFVKISGAGLENHSICPNDGITINGIGYQEGVAVNSGVTSLNGSKVVIDCGSNYIIIEGVIGNGASAQVCEASPITIERTVPQLDFIVEAGNRLWGCKRDANEIYACKLGDFKNWNCFQGLSTDSWVGNVGTPGEFTGVAVQNGYPVFYKENCKHKVWPSATGAHQITTVPCDGVKKGCENTLAVWEGTVFYWSPAGARADDGGGPVDIGDYLGEQKCESAAGTVSGQKYYLSMKDKSGQYHLFVYDLKKGFWHREDGTTIGNLVSGDGSLYAACKDELWDLTGNTGTLEEDVSWFAVTGDLGLELPEQKYISRLTLRLSLDPGATLEVYAQYDREQTWVKLGQVYGTDLRSFSLPVRPRRCDQLRLKLQGTGMCKLYSITKTLEKGSELT